MNKLADYLMTHHLSAMGNEANANVDDAALEVIMEQDDLLQEAHRIIKYYVHDDPEPAESWLREYHPTPPAQVGRRKR